MAPEHERELVERARREPAAFGELYDFYLPRIYGFIYRRIEERSVAEDLTATTFERGLEALRRGSFRNEAFGGWLYRVAANATVDHARRGRRLLSFDWLRESRFDDPIPASELERASDAFAAAIDADELRRAVERLPDTHRRVLTLRFFDDLDADEASAILGCSKPTFAVKLHRALAALRGEMMAESTDAA